MPFGCFRVGWLAVAVPPGRAAVCDFRCGDIVVSGRRDCACQMAPRGREAIVAALHRAGEQSQDSPLSEACPPRMEGLDILFYLFLLLCRSVCDELLATPMIKSTGVKTAFSVGLLTAIPCAAAAIGMVLIGGHSDRTLERRWHTLICSVVGALGLVICATYPSSTWISVVAARAGWLGMMALVSLFWSTHSDFGRDSCRCRDCLGQLHG